MNEPRTFSPAHLKVLFKRLVDAVGKQDAAAELLGVSRQRVGQLVSGNDEFAKECPTWAQVWTLEDRLGRSIVFEGLAQAVDPMTLPATACVVKEAHDVFAVAAMAGPAALAVERGEPGAMDALEAIADRLKAEIAEVRAAASNVQTLRRA